MNATVSSMEMAGLRIKSTLRDTAGRWKSLLARESTTDDDAPSTHRSECIHSETSPYEVFRDRLPLELWFLIVRHALEPRFAILHEFLPQDIHFFYISLIIHQFSCPDRTEIKRTRASLRLVCKNLNTIVKKITSNEEENPSWIRSYSPDNALRYGPCSRLDVGFRDLGDIAKLRKQYPHDVGTVYINVQNFNDPRDDCYLSALLASPWTLKVLHITLPGATYGALGLPFSIFSELSSLQTLSIAAQNPLKLTGVLGMPHLTTLFITCVPAPRSDVTRWLFPKLANLTIDTRGWPFSSTGDSFDDLFNALIKNHMQTIKSLRLVPMMQPSFAPFSHWTTPSLLEAVATDFVRYNPKERLNRQPWYGMVLHLTHISTNLYPRSQLTKALLDTLKCFPSARTLAITEDPFLRNISSQDNEQDNNALEPGCRELEKLCRLRAIRIVGGVGNDVCCISKFCRSLTVPPLQDS